MLHEFIRDPKGKHQIGGDKPDYLTIPEHQFITDFQYLGFIDNTDEVFTWLPFKTHLICPIYLDIGNVFLDYANPNAPTIISPQDTASVTTAYDDLDRNSLIVYEATQVNTQAVSAIDDMHCIGVAGEPEWLQSTRIPVCPKSGKPMRFLCELMTFGNIPAKYTNVEGEDFSRMAFWGDGNLYVFIQPEEKTVCYFIQNT